MLPCSRSVHVNISEFGKSRTDKLAFEGGFVFDDDGKSRVLLIFYRSNLPFTVDTDHALYLYIIYNGAYSQYRAEARKAEVFFVRVQRAPCYGFMRSEGLVISKRPDNTITVSGQVISDVVYPERHGTIKLSLCFNDLPIVAVESMDDILRHSNDFHIEKLNEYFGEYLRRDRRD